ncbi:DUF3987 domain-containing protein [Streptomyces sp. URMC 125]|uniref:DUF3987 domain-containing protein n=1 Tax=Streptomyces sp. URMC 125 TaxID=3423419 RepID=UPI003F19A1CF
MAFKELAEVASFKDMAYGPIGEAVKKAMPYTEADEIGVYAAALSMYAAAINGTVTFRRRPVGVWTVLVGRSSGGRKGTASDTARAMLDTAIDDFLFDRTVSGITSGPSLVNHLWKTEVDSLTSRDGVDGRVLLMEEEWAATLKRSRRCPTFSQQLRTAWDGKAIRNITKGKGEEARQEVTRPLLGFHAHITPAEWTRHVSSDEALGGTFNRLLPVMVERSKMLPSRDDDDESDWTLDIPRADALKEAYEWARETPRSIGFTKQAATRYDELRWEIEDHLAELPEEVACFMERTTEQVSRVAAVLAASEMKTKISVKALNAAWAFVRYSMATVEYLIKNAGETGRRIKPLSEVIRDALIACGGEATSTELHAKVKNRTNAAGLKAEVEAMPNVEVVKVKTGKPGAPKVVYRLKTEESEVKPEPQDQGQDPGRPTLRLVEPEPAPRPARRTRTRATNKPKTETQRPKTQRSKAQPTRAPRVPESNPFADLLSL